MIHRDHFLYERRQSIFSFVLQVDLFDLPFCLFIQLVGLALVVEMNCLRPQLIDVNVLFVGVVVLAIFKDKAVFRDAFLAEAEQNRFHPIREYLNGLEWDGVDRFPLIGEYIKDQHGMSAELVKKFMVGAVSRNMMPTFMAMAKEQNPMLVLVGGQGLGKSVLSAWFGGVLTHCPLPPSV